MSDHGAVKVEQAGKLARIVFNRPQAFNALNSALAAELKDALLRIEADDTVRALVITGAGKAFCAGGDLHAFAEAGPKVRRAIGEILESAHGAVEILDRLSIPTIAAVNGAAAGIGLSIASACDLRFAARSAKFTLAYTGVGLSPDGSSSYHLPRLLGLARALDIALTNRTLDAAEAESWGLVSRVFPDDAFASEVDTIALRLADGPTGSLAAAKRLMRESWTSSLGQQLDREGESIAHLAATADGQEGITAFVEKRTPKFAGGAAGQQVLPGFD
ncbi:MAG TPA: enoyl-CoA hydratase [Pseudonocardia sp.]|jgi:2-(1,2-epoxy-1,2-dihydrophenyl)acetyl-CoA isomerase|nr:enoyl-CoA hydratase [Pseudonocardia sp.]